jgi:hypothetical protein
MIGTVDRIEDGKYAVIISSEDNFQEVLELTNLPKDAQHEGAVVEVQVDDNSNIVNLEYKSELEKERRERINSKRQSVTETKEE